LPRSLKKTSLHSRTELALFAHHCNMLGDSYPGGNESAGFPHEGRCPEYENARETRAHGRFQAGRGGRITFWLFTTVCRPW
jgi:hypothetical protein